VLLVDNLSRAKHVIGESREQGAQGSRHLGALQEPRGDRHGLA
jgi:hypothetical protein